MKKTKIAVYSIVILFLAANLYVNFQVQSKINQLQAADTPKKLLACESVPISWAVDNYDCANKLLEAMNVANVKILPKNSTNTMIERVRARLRNNSYS